MPASAPVCAWTTTISWSRSRNCRASSYVLHPEPPQTGGNASVTSRILMTVGERRARSRAKLPDRAIERAAVRGPTVLANRALAGGAAQTNAQHGISEAIERVGEGL